MTIIGITGTDTGVGKTVVGCAMAAALVKRGTRVGVMKPVESGVSATTPSDAVALATAARCQTAVGIIRPYAFAAPLAPMVAARLVGTSVELRRLEDALDHIVRDHECVIVEGAGGLLVPVSETLDFADVLASFRARLVVVARNRLGAINHTLLTLQAARAAGLDVAAVVVHDDSPDTADEASRSNVSVITELAAPMPVVRFPWVVSVSDRAALEAAAESAGILDHLFPVSLGVSELRPLE